MKDRIAVFAIMNVVDRHLQNVISGQLVQASKGAVLMT